MAAYKTIEVELRDIIGVLHNGNYDEVEKRLTDVIEDLEMRNKNNTKKVLNARRNSRRATKLHNVDNKLRYARKNNDLEAIKRLEEEKDYIKRNILD